jgi:hypothetical protein
MANCSIPNSSPASGRILTRSLRRSRRQNSQLRISFAVVGAVQKRPQVRHVHSVLGRTATLQSALRARKIRSAIRNRQSQMRRVKGAWWPSRSSKPSLPRKWRGRFDSYPLRHIICDCRLPIVDCSGEGRMISITNRNSKIENPMKGGEPYVA